MPYCGEQTLVKYQGQQRQAVSLRCRSWGCVDCAPQRQRQLVAQIVGGSPRQFLTLTIRQSHHRDPNEAAIALAHAWRDMRKRLMYWRRLKKLPFLAVFERHLSGWPHLHIFLRTEYIPQKELSCWMSWLIDSPVVHIKAIANSAQAAGYAAKYTTKENVKFGNCKRYWQSADYDLRPEHQATPPSAWLSSGEIDARPIRAIARAWIDLAWKVTWVSPREVRAVIPP